MGINRVSGGKTGAPNASSGSKVAEPTKPFTVQRTERAATAPAAFEAAPISERVVKSTRHLQGVVPHTDLRMIRETLEDKLEADPMLVDLLHRAGAGKS